MTKEKLTSFIPAGGRGERLKPLTEKFPKPLLLMGEANKRIIDYVLTCVKSSSSNIIISISHAAQCFEKYFTCPDNDTQFIHDRYILNIGGSLLQHYYWINKNAVFGDFLLIAPADHVVENIKIEQMLKAHMEKQADITVGLVSPRLYGDYLEINKDKFVIGFGTNSTGKMSSTGIYIFRTNFLMDMLRKEINSGWDNSPFDIGRDIVMPAIGKSRIAGFIFSAEAYWDDAGTIERYYSNNMRISKGNSVIATNAFVENREDVIQSIILDESLVPRGKILSRSIVPPFTNLCEKTHAKGRIVKLGSCHE